MKTRSNRVTDAVAAVATRRTREAECVGGIMAELGKC